MLDFLESIGRYKFQDVLPVITWMLNTAFSMFCLYLSSYIKRKNEGPYTAFQIALKSVLWILAFINSFYFIIGVAMFYHFFIGESYGLIFDPLIHSTSNRAEYIFYSYSHNEITRSQAELEIKNIYKEAQKHVHVFNR